jgi:hypothetical protein
MPGLVLLKFAMLEMKIVIVGLAIDGREWLKSRIESGHGKCKVTVA